MRSPRTIPFNAFADRRTGSSRRAVRNLFTFILGALCWLSCASVSLDAQVWRKQHSGITAHLEKIFFIDSLRGWACGDRGTILRTLDGGEHWIRCAIPDTLSPYYSLFFTDRLHGWAVGWKMLETTDGGLSWSYRDPGIQHTFRDIYFIDRDNGWCVGGGGFFGAILRTRDRGAHWQVLENSDKGGYWAVQFLDSLVGWIVGHVGFDNFDPDIILHTTDGGDTWREQVSPKVGGLYALHMMNRTTGFAGGFTNTPYPMITTSDGGATWIPAGPSFLPNFVLTCIESVSASTYFTGGTIPYLLKSSDTGRIWLQESMEEPNDVTSISCYDSARCWACGFDGSIWTNRPVVTSSAAVQSVPERNSMLSCSYSQKDNVLRVEYNAGAPGLLTITVHDMLLRTLHTQTRLSPSGLTTTVIPVGALRSGAYFVRASMHNEVAIKTFLVVN